MLYGQVMRAVVAVMVLLLSWPALAEDCRMPRVSRAMINELTANPEKIGFYYDMCRTTFINELGPAFANLNEDGRKLAWASVMAYELKPYGGSMAFSFKDLIAASVLDCDNYVFLTWHLFRTMKPLSPIGVRMVGWNGGAVGNHAQIFTEGTGVPLLLDPTIGLVAVASFDQVAKGQPVTAFKEFYWRTELATFRANVVAALTGGLYKPSDLLYWFPEPDDYVDALSHIKEWATPQAPAIAPR